MVTDSNELLGQTLGTCTLQRLLGRGGMGAVYLARQSRPRRIVAVKVLLPGVVLEHRSRNEFLARFRREADAIAALDHINIMPVYEYGEQGDLAFLVMPYVTGGTLRDVLEKRGILSLEEVVPIIEQAAAALDCAHAQTIVHRDLKPGNIIFHADGRILLADFGLAKVLKEVTDQENSQGHLTSVGTIVGTPEYLSPEQGTGDTIDYRTDVYSLGVVLYQMLAGRVPFTGTSPVAVAIKHTLEQPPPMTRFNPQVPKDIEAVVMKAMAKSPSQRFNSAGMFAQALRQAVSEALGDHFPSSLPLSAGEQFTPVYPLTQEKITEAPPERRIKDSDMPTKITNPSNGEDQAPGMSTVLMENENVGNPNNTTEADPRLSEHTQNRLQALPTVITELDATIADYPGTAPRNVPAAKSPTRETTTQQPSRKYPPANGPHQRPPTTDTPAPEQRSYNHPVPQKEHTIEHSTQWHADSTAQQQQLQAPLEQRPGNYPVRKNSASKLNRLALIGAILVIIIIIGGVATFFANQKSNTSPHATTTLTGTAATSTAISKKSKSTPQAQATPTSTTKSAYSLPGPQAPGAGRLIYSTNYPGKCDSNGGTWQNINIQAKCPPGSPSNPTQLELTNPTSSNAGTILTKISNGTPLPSSYYIQVQVTLNTPDSQFGIFYHWSSNLNYEYIVNSNTWGPYYNMNGSPTLMTEQLYPISGTTLDKTATIDITVNQGSFHYYINGEPEGNANGAYGGTSTGGDIGFTVSQGSDVSFKNLAIYTYDGP